MISKKKLNQAIKKMTDTKGQGWLSYKLRQEFLSKWSFEEIKQLQCVMYIGRDGWDDCDSPETILAEMRVHLDNVGWNDKQEEINLLAGKVSCHEYLIKGKKILNL